MKTPKMAGLATVAVAFIAGLIAITLASCSVTPSGPVSAGASHGALGSDNMCDYYYKKSAGWIYAFNNVQNIYNADGSIRTLTGAPDTVRTLGFYAVAPNGDSLYRLAITYRASTARGCPCSSP
jgi:ABC-type phosphate transport system substrate-binding protein